MKAELEKRPTCRSDPELVLPWVATPSLLVTKVEDVFSQPDNGLMGWKRAMANWRQLEKAMHGEGASLSLTPPLNSSWASISEWISGDLQEPELTAAIQDWISGIETESTWPPQAADVASKLAVASQYYDAPLCLRLSDSIYHAKLFDRF